MKTKINKWDLIKLKDISTAKKTMNTTNRLGENICKLCDYKGLVFEIYKQLMKHNINKTNNPINKWAENLN